jgi:hypothetical protein
MIPSVFGWAGRWWCNRDGASMRTSKVTAPIIASLLFPPTLWEGPPAELAMRKGRPLTVTSDR